MNFADMNSVITNLTQPDHAGFGSRSEGMIREKGQEFASKLDSEIQKMDAQAAGQNQNTKIVKIGTPKIANEGSSQKNGLKFLSDLENVILKLSGGDLNTVSINQEGLDVLKKLLVKAGFDPEEVSGMIDRLKEKAGEEGLELGEVMDNLSLLETDTQEAGLPEDVLLETSALPFIVSLLDKFGFPRDLTGTIMEKADKGREGISLDVVVEELKAISSQYGSAGLSQEIKADAGSVYKVLGQLNMAVPENTGAEKVSLKDLLSAFDTFIKSQVQARESVKNTAGQGIDNTITESAGSLVDKLFESFTGLGEKNNTPEFSFQQVKDQFKNELMIPDKGKKVKPGLFSQNQSNSAASPDTFLKELETVFSKPGAQGSRGDAEGRSDFQRETKTEHLKNVDIHHSAASLGKNDVGENMLNGLRAKSPERALPSYVTQQVNKSIIRAINQGESSLTLQLKPAALGRLTLTIDNTGNSLKVSIITENHAAKEMLASNVSELKTALSSAGISLDSFDVDMSSNFKQSMADTRNPARSFNRKNGRNGHADSDGEDLEVEDNFAGIPGRMPMDGAYHFVA